MSIGDRRISNPRFLLAFPPLQYASGEMVRPDGSLALPYLDAALTLAGFDSQILDMSVGTAQDRLEDTFYRCLPLSPTMTRVGLTPERIVEEVRDFDVIGLTSTFTQQTARCFEVAELVKRAYPQKLLIAGGVNARSLREHFFDHGFDVVFLSEAERAIVEFARWLHSGTPTLGDVRGIAYRPDGRTIITAPPDPVVDLDDVPMPSWHKLPNERYWEIARIWGGREGWINGEAKPHYAAIVTSRGCPFRCSYCHISSERNGLTGGIAKPRVHSVDRVERELSTLRELDVHYLYVNDDSFLAKKERALAILERMRHFRFTLANVNGVNIIHLFKRQGSRLVVDEELLAALYGAGFRKISLPFESGTQRLIDKYSSAKWNIEQCNVVELVRKMNELGLAADGNFIIGYPDETLDELTCTFLLARRLREAGLIACQFFMLQPFPGTRLFEESLSSGQLPASWHWDDLGWSKGSPFANPTVDKQVLKYSWELAWKLLNRDARIEEFSAQLG